MYWFKIIVLFSQHSVLRIFYQSNCFVLHCRENRYRSKLLLSFFFMAEFVYTLTFNQAEHVLILGPKKVLSCDSQRLKNYFYESKFHLDK